MNANYFVHCSAVCREKNILNSKLSTVLGVFCAKGEPYEKVVYNTPNSIAINTLKTQFLNSIELSVRNYEGKLIDFKNFPIDFVLEII